MQKTFFPTHSMTTTHERMADAAEQEGGAIVSPQSAEPINRFLLLWRTCLAGAVHQAADRVGVEKGERLSTGEIGAVTGEAIEAVQELLETGTAVLPADLAAIASEYVRRAEKTKRQSTAA